MQEVLKHVRSRWFKVVNDVLTPALRNAPPQPVQAFVDGSALAGLPRVPSMSSLLRVRRLSTPASHRMSCCRHAPTGMFVPRMHMSTAFLVAWRHASRGIQIRIFIRMRVHNCGAAGVQEATQQVRLPTLDSWDEDRAAAMTALPAAVVAPASAATAEASFLPIDPRRAGNAAAAAPAAALLPQDPRAAADAPPGGAQQLQQALPKGMGRGLGHARPAGAAGTALQGGATGQPVPLGGAQSKMHRVRPPICSCTCSVGPDREIQTGMHTLPRTIAAVL